MEEQAIYQVKVKPKESARKGNLFFLSALILMIIGSIALEYIDALPNGINLLPTTRTMMVEYGLLIPVIVFFVITKQSFVETMKLKNPGFVNMILIIPLAICLMPAVGFLSALTTLFAKNHLLEAISQFPKMSLGMWILTLAITPAICEEMIMRGLVFGNYKHINIKKAALMNGLMFGIIHLNVNQFVYAFVLGVVMAYIVHYTGSIFPSIFLHFCINGTSAFANWALQYYTEIFDDISITEIASNQDTMAMLPKQAVFAAIGTLFAWLLLKTYKMRNEGNYDDDKSSDEKVFDVYVGISILIFIGFMFIIGI